MAGKQTPRWAGGKPSAGSSSGTTVAQRPDAAAGLRQRRLASLRLGPYGNGPADPLDDLAGLAIAPAGECPGEFGEDGRWRPHCGHGAA